MTKLSDSQLVALSAACARDDRSVYPLTLKAKGNAAGKVLKSLLAKGLVEEVQARRDDEVWRETRDGTRLTLRATDAAFQALGIETGAAVPTGKDESPAKTKKGRRGGRATAKQGDGAVKKPTRGKKAGKASGTTRADSKQARLIEMLKRPKGASIEEIVEAFGWQPHTVRGAIAGALKKKLGLEVTSEKADRRRVYRIAG